MRGSVPVTYHVEYTIGTTVLRWDDFKDIGNKGPLTFAGAYPKNAVDNDNCFYILRAANPDLLIAPTVTVAKGEPVRLAFRHVMHRLVVNLSGNALTADELSQASVRLSESLYCCAVVDFTNATALADNSAIYGDNPPTRTGATTTFILVPQDIHSLSEKITITAGVRNSLTPSLPSCPAPQPTTHPAACKADGRSRSTSPSTRQTAARQLPPSRPPAPRQRTTQP